MMKRFLILLFVLILAILCSFSSFAGFVQELPDYVPLVGGVYIVLENTNIGTGTIVFTSQIQNNTFTFSRDNGGAIDRLVNISSSTVNGIFYREGGRTYNIRAQRLGNLEYQSDSSGYQNWYELTYTLSEDINSNIVFMTSDELLLNNTVPDYDKMTFVCVVLLVFCEFSNVFISILRRGRR